MLGRVLEFLSILFFSSGKWKGGRVWIACYLKFLKLTSVFSFKIKIGNPELPLENLLIFPLLNKKKKVSARSQNCGG